MENTRSGAADFEALYAEYATDVLRVCYYYLGDRQKAEDVTQDVFVKLLTANPTLETGHEKAWLLKVALNRCKDLWRASWTRRVMLGTPAFELAPAPDDLAAVTESQDLLAAVNRLPGEFKEVVLLYYYQNYQISEIARILDQPEGTVSSRLSRARKKLQAMLQE